MKRLVAVLVPVVSPWFRALQMASWAFIISWIAYYGLFERPWLRYLNVPFPMVLQTVRVGEPIRYLVAKCNDSKQTRQYLVAREMVSEDDPNRAPIVIRVVDPVTAAAGCDEFALPTAATSNLVPPGTPPGRYHLRGSAQIEGEYRTRLVPWETQPFEVVR